MRSKVKVSRERLIEAIKARRAEAKNKHEADKKKYEAEAASYEMRLVDALEDAIAAAEKGKVVFTGYGSSSTKRYKLNLPMEPDVVKGKFDGGKYDRDIAILEMSPEDTISISTEDFERYVR